MHHRLLPLPHRDANENKTRRKQHPIGNRERKRRINGITFPGVGVSAVGGATFIVAADVDGDGDPDGEEEGPVCEFQGQG
jgi:hypothetical protein